MKSLYLINSSYIAYCVFFSKLSNKLSFYKSLKEAPIVDTNLLFPVSKNS